MSNSNKIMMMMMLYCLSTLSSPPSVAVEGFVLSGPLTSRRRIQEQQRPFLTTCTIKESRLDVNNKKTKPANSSSNEKQQLSSFDPFGLSSSSSNVETSITGLESFSNAVGAASSSLEHSKQGQTIPPPAEKEEMGIWAARGILLLVAAIWGTNFAVG
jgi:hypothetical protein